MRKSLGRFLGVLVLGGVICVATPIPGLVSTGGAAPGTQDPAWTYFYSPVPVSTGFVFTPAFVTDDAGYPFPTWLPNSGGSKWISPQAGYGPSHGAYSDGAGYYFFTLPFVIGAGYDPDTASFSYQLTVDNTLNSIWLNGQYIAAGGVGTYNTMSGPYSVNALPGLFKPGINYLSVIVTNTPTGPVDPNIVNTWNPAGLRFEILASDITYTPPPSPEIPEPGTLVLFALGLMALGAKRFARG